MKYLIIPVAAAVLLTFSQSSCKSSSAPLFCDTTCTNEPIGFSQGIPDSPYVSVSINNCIPDTITWSHRMLATKRKMGYYELVGKEARLNKDYMKCYFKDTSYAWLQFNDCITGRGFLVKLPYSKDDRWSIYTSALNNIDPKFSVAEGYIAYYDETFIYVQELATGKKGKMLMNDSPLKIDHNDIHKTIDSVHVTGTKVWARLNIGNDWKDKEKEITLE